MRSRRCLLALGLAAVLQTSLGCGRRAAAVPELVSRRASFPGFAAVKVEPWEDRKWVVLLETLQEQLQVTEPHRKLVWLDEELRAVDEYAPAAGSSLIDFAV